ncbi:MAG: hypothetical protein OEX12_10300 [Gammaproteobacteria bacterium]|nr:hypothetical protein [Gammaproteobacteria bacterium]
MQYRYIARIKQEGKSGMEVRNGGQGLNRQLSKSENGQLCCPQGGAIATSTATISSGTK